MSLKAPAKGGTRRVDRDRPTPRRAKGARRRDPIDAMYEDADEIPQVSFEEQRRTGKKSLRRLRRLLLINIPLNLVLGLGLLLVGAAWANQAITPPAPPQEIKVTEVGRTQAESSLQQWLEQEGSAFSGATIASWDGVSNRTAVPKSDDEPGFEALTHNFTIRTKSGDYMRASVRIAYSPQHGAKVISTPTVTALAASATNDWDPDSTVPGWTTASATQPVSDAISAWGQAMTGTPQDLKLAVRDETSGHVYSTLSGVSYVSVNPASALTPADKNGARTDPSTVVVTVTLNVKASDAASDDDRVTPVQYDVLVRGADTAAPYVTAWGGVGSGPTLKDHSNSVSLTGQVDGSAPSGASDGGGADPSPAQSATASDPAQGGN